KRCAPRRREAGGCAASAACRNLAPVNAPRPASSRPRLRIRAAALIALAVMLAAGCSREADQADTAGETAVAAGDGSVTISGDDSIAERLTWRAPDVVLPD